MIADLAEHLDAGRMLDAAPTAALAWVQRLGYLLDIVGAGEKADLLAEYVLTNVRDAVALAPSET